MKFLLLSILVVFAFADEELLKKVLNAEEHLKSWDEFKKSYGKSYKTPEEEASRFSIFVGHSLNIARHNAEEDLDHRHGYTLGINEFADLSGDEFVAMYNGYKMRDDSVAHEKRATFIPPENLQLPGTVDWRNEGLVTGIKNQGQCGSCWAFSTTGSLEGQHKKKTGNLVSLSEQNLVDCAGGKYGNQGCNGGLMDQAFNYIHDNGGIDTEASYPYTARDGTCHYNKANSGATLVSHTDIPSKDESALQKAVASVGPISVAIDASHFTFQLYHSGVYDPWFCSQTNLDHGVLAVGYGTSNGKAYWLVKNSWGTTWGMKGYIMMVRNNNNKCGIATQASYPNV